jgi:hypothetical protein
VSENEELDREVGQLKGRAEELGADLERARGDYDDANARMEVCGRGSCGFRDACGGVPLRRHSQIGRVCVSGNQALEHELAAARASGDEALGAATAEADRLRAEVAEIKKRLADSEREGDALEERIAELEGQLAARARQQPGPVRGAEGSPRGFVHVDKAEKGKGGKATGEGHAAGLMEAGEDTAGGRSAAAAASAVEEYGRRGKGVPPLELRLSPVAPSTFSSRANSEDFAATTSSLGEQYVVVKQLTNEFQAQRARDLQVRASVRMVDGHGSLQAM